MCNDVQECAAQSANDKTNPPSPTGLTDRQVTAARLLVMARSARQVAREVGINEHTVGRWRQTRGFRDELRRQHAQALAEEVRLSRAESVDAYAAVAERIARRYGMKS
jgi:FixJ family two-component response regulator